MAEFDQAQAQLLENFDEGHFLRTFDHAIRTNYWFMIREEANTPPVTKLCIVTRSVRMVVPGFREFGLSLYPNGNPTYLDMRIDTSSWEEGLAPEDLCRNLMTVPDIQRAAYLSDIVLAFVNNGHLSVFFLTAGAAMFQQLHLEQCSREIRRSVYRRFEVTQR